jgi:uncharacterized protein (TIGR03000 family)
MSRWQMLFVAVAAFGPATSVRAFPAAGDWSDGYEVNFSYAAPKSNSGPGRPSQPNSPVARGTRPGPVTPPPSLSPPPKLHVLLLVDDTNKDAGPANKAGAAVLEKALRDGLPADRLGTVVTIAGAGLTPDGVRGRIAALGVRPQDALIAFYSGAVDYDERSRSYTLIPAAGGRIARTDLRDWLLARRAKLTVLLTDAPASRIDVDMLPASTPPEGPTALDRLVFYNRGFVDLHAAAGGEIAFPRSGEGGQFTLALVEELRNLKADGPDPAWPDFVERVKSTADRLYGDYRKALLSSDKVSAEDKRTFREQPHQTVTALTPLDRVAPALPPAKPAEIVVRVPAGTKLFIEDRPTKLTGAERHFETAELKPGKDYFYTIRAEFDGNGRSPGQTQRITVHAGETVEVRFGVEK